MSTKLMMTPSEVVDYAFATGEYVAPGAITEQMILSAQLRYLTPIMGEALVDTVADGEYEDLREDYIAPTLALMTRIEAEIEAYPATSIERERGKLFLRTLSDYLNASQDLFVEYDQRENVMNRCQILGGFVL